jgi:acetamidase/formamidase
MALYHFQPTRYQNTFGSHEPVLRIAEGDTVRTTTVDSTGVDANGYNVAERPNPLTGPFFVEGAVPGDTLLVHIDHLVPIRDSGYSYSMLAPNVVHPGYVHVLPERQKVDWDIQRGESTATLITPIARLINIPFRLNPMLGCLGVAPEGGQAISSATSGAYGGNMDYRGFVSGVMAYFPVFVHGALLHIGDGHALQGDGEVVGRGIETPFEVQFTVNLLKGKQILWPRGENTDYIFSVGNARPLDLALQYATTEMLCWLMEDYGLDAHGASILLGMCVEYDVGNIFNPAYTMVCKLPKRLLAALSA